MSDQYVRVPRELLERIVAVYASSPWPSWYELRAALEAAPAEDVRAVVDEPVAWLVEAADENGTVRLSTVAKIQWTSGNRDMDEWAAGRIVTNTPLYRHPQRPVVVPAKRLEMADVVRAHMDIPHCPVLTSNQCHALAMKLNACVDEFKRLNP